LPRDLADVADYFLPRSDTAVRAARPPVVLERPPPPVDASRPAALPIVAVPVGDRDVVRAAFLWNVAVEVARLGASATLLAPADAEPSPLWPEAGPGPIGAELVLARADSLAQIHRAALDVAVARAADSPDGGLVLVRVPPAWLGRPCEGRALLRWVLLFASTERLDLLETYALAKQAFATSHEARVGVTIHGARRIADAQNAFLHLADVAARYLGQPLASYGLLVDDLHVYRAIVSHRPIGIEHPQSRAARALRDVARLLLDDARKALPCATSR
jgi:hypothetical protein